MSGPMRPSEVAARKAASIPDQVYEAFNELIAKNWDGRESRLLQKHAATLAIEKLAAAGRKVTLDQLYDNNWMDVEGAYRKVGWLVEYDKPGYCESYDAAFTFKKGKRAQ